MKPVHSKPLHTRGRTIGLLGGSFNPAHGGHLHITLHALNALGLDEVWWLVSPKNPLKSAGTLALYEDRLASAREVARPYRRVRVLDIERQWGTKYSWQTIAKLKENYPGTHFVWMIGADNLAQLHRWKKWQWLLGAVPVVVFDRAPYSHTALRSKAMLRMRKFAIKNNGFNRQKDAPWLQFVHLRRNPLSSTSIRKTLGTGAFLGHNGN